MTTFTQLAPASTSPSVKIGRDNTAWYALDSAAAASAGGPPGDIEMSMDSTSASARQISARVAWCSSRPDQKPNSGMSRASWQYNSPNRPTAWSHTCLAALECPPGPAHGGRADLRQFGGAAGLDVPEGAGSGSCEVAAGTGHRGDACGQRGARPGHEPAALRRCALSKHGGSFALGCYHGSGRVGPTGARRACRRMGGLSDRGGISIGDLSPRQAADRLPRS